MVKVIGASFPKTGTKSLWRALVYLGYNHFESPNWVDRMLDDWVSFMKVSISHSKVKALSNSQVEYCFVGRHQLRLCVPKIRRTWWRVIH